MQFIGHHFAEQIQISISKRLNDQCRAADIVNRIPHRNFLRQCRARLFGGEVEIWQYDCDMHIHPNGNLPRNNFSILHRGHDQASHHRRRDVIRMPLHFTGEIQNLLPRERILQQRVPRQQPRQYRRGRRPHPRRQRDSIHALRMKRRQRLPHAFRHPLRRADEEIIFSRSESPRTFARHLHRKFFLRCNRRLIPQIQCQTEGIEPWSQVGRCSGNFDGEFHKLFYHEGHKVHKGRSKANQKQIYGKAFRPSFV